MRKQSGLSLVELMIAIALGLVLMLGLVQMFISSKVIFSTQQGMSRIQETGRLAIEFLSRDIRMAAYYGCYRPIPGNVNADLQNKNLIINGLHGNFGQGIIGYKSVEELPNKKNDLSAGLTYLTTGIQNVLVVRSANEVGLPVSAANDPGNVFVYRATPLVDGCANGICKDAAAVVSDCSKARVFKVAKLSPANPTLTISHDDVWGGGTNALENFTSGEVLPLHTTIFFIAKRQADAPPSLYQKIDGQTLELLEGVEQMLITYSVDGETYKRAEDVDAADWSDVYSVRVELAVRSLENNVIETTQKYMFGGVEVTPVTEDGIVDRYMRQVFTTTVSIRSRTAMD